MIPAPYPRPSARLRRPPLMRRSSRGCSPNFDSTSLATKTSRTQEISLKTIWSLPVGSGIGFARSSDALIVSMNTRTARTKATSGKSAIRFHSGIVFASSTSNSPFSEERERNSTGEQAPIRPTASARL